MELRKHLSVGVMILALGAFSTRDARALSSFSPGDLSSMTDAAAKSLIETVAIGADHRAYEPASHMRVVIGLDVGIDLTLLNVPQAFKDALVSANAVSGGATQVPSTIALPRLNIHKGLPFGLGVGFSYFGYNNYKLYGGDLQWTFVRGFIHPAAAIRLSQSYTDLFFMKTHTTSVDLLVSKHLAVFEPYAGVGYQFGSGDLDVAPGSLPSSVSGHQSMSDPRVFVGLPIHMLLLRLTAQYEYSFAKIATYGLKASLHF